MKLWTLRTRNGWLYRCDDCGWEQLHATRANADTAWREHVEGHRPREDRR